LLDEFDFVWASFEGQQPTRRGSQAVHIFILYDIRIESWCRIVQSKLRRRGRIQRILGAKKPMFGEKVLEYLQLAYVDNMDDDNDGTARLKTEIELREQNNSRLS
jgi:hypothetical protein